MERNDITVLGFFRQRREDPLIRFLTWYCMLYLRWDLTDITQSTIERAIRDEQTGDWIIGCQFYFRDHSSETLMVMKQPDGTFYVQPHPGVIRELTRTDWMGRNE